MQVFCAYVQSASNPCYSRSPCYFLMLKNDKECIGLLQQPLPCAYTLHARISAPLSPHKYIVCLLLACTLHKHTERFGSLCWRTRLVRRCRWVRLGALPRSQQSSSSKLMVADGMSTLQECIKLQHMLSQASWQYRLIAKMSAAKSSYMPKWPLFTHQNGCLLDTVHCT
jgi:hypothetical protein